MRFAVLPLATLALALAACSAEPADNAAPEGEASTAAADVSSINTNTVQPAASDEPTLDLQATGIIVPPQAGFEQLDVPFGSMREATEATLRNVLGEPKISNSPNDCGLTTTAYEGLALSFRDGKFVGYTANAPYVPDLTRAEMLKDPQVKLLEDSTIDGEFTIGSGAKIISGVFVGDEVRALYAGETCIAR